METTLVGVIKVEPKQLLEDGIRKVNFLRLFATNFATYFAILLQLCLVPINFVVN